MQPSCVCCSEQHLTYCLVCQTNVSKTGLDRLPLQWSNRILRHRPDTFSLSCFLPSVTVPYKFYFHDLSSSAPLKLSIYTITIPVGCTAFPLSPLQAFSPVLPHCIWATLICFYTAAWAIFRSMQIALYQPPALKILLCLI